MTGELQEELDATIAAKNKAKNEKKKAKKAKKAKIAAANNR